MTVNFTTAQVTFLGNDSTKVFDFGFPLYALADMQVFLTDITTGEDTQQLSNFTINPATPGIFPTIGTVTFPVTGSPIDANTKITLRRKTPYAQEFLDLGRTTIINAGILEDAIDRVVGMIQQNQTLTLRSLKVGITEGELSVQEFVDTLLIPTVASAIIDNLTTANPGQALSANQGVVLKALIDALQVLIDNLPVVIDNLTTASVVNSLSANQGVILKGLIDALPAVIDNLSSTSAVNPLSANQGFILKAQVDALGAAPVKSSQAENEAGTDDTKFVSPLGIRQAFRATGSAPVFAVRVWGNFDGSIGSPQTRAGGNVSSFVENATADYTLTFSTAIEDTNYGVMIFSYNPSTNNANFIISITSKTTTSIRFRTASRGSSGNDPAFFEAHEQINVIITR